MKRLAKIAVIISFGALLCSSHALADQPGGSSDGELQLGPPGHTWAAEEYERFEREVIGPFLASRAWGDEIVREEPMGDSGYQRYVTSISNWHDPKWDDAAEAFLRNWGRTMCELPNAPSYVDLSDEGMAVINLGCREPMVIYATSWTLLAINRQLSRHLEVQAVGMNLTAYPAGRKALAQSRLAASLERSSQDQQAAHHHRAAGRLVIEAIEAGEYEGVLSQRHLLNVANRCTASRVPVEVAEEFLAQFKTTPGVEPATLHTCLGEYHIRRAWDHRGSGLAKTVTAEGWAGFEKHMTIARNHLLEAYELDPSRPEAATAMITLCIAGHGPDGTDELSWLERAITAQMDFMPAYNSMLYSLSPRWGGSHGAALELGVVCAASGRYDTELPLVLLYAVQQIYLDALHPGRAVLTPAVYDLVVEVTEQLAAHPNHHHRRNWLRSVRAAVALHSGRFDDVRTVAAELGDDLDASALSWFQTKVEDIERVAGGQRVTSAGETHAH